MNFDAQFQGTATDISEFFQAVALEDHCLALASLFASLARKRFMRFRIQKQKHLRTWMPTQVLEL